MRDIIRLMRPHEWIKNVLVLAGPVFAARLADPRGAIAFVAFCLVSSAGYAINDVLDREADEAHPEKRDRPIASGAVSPRLGVVFGIVLLALSLAITIVLPRAVTWIVLGYFILMIVYSVDLKHRAIIDVIVIAIGFVLRAIAGSKSIDLVVSPWLMVCTFTLCLFLGFGKRRCELSTLSDRGDATAHRPTLMRYTPELLNHLTSVAAGIAIVTFLIYTLDHNPQSPAFVDPGFRKDYLLYTLPLVAYGLFRYAMLVESGRFTGPTQIILKDFGLIVTGILWAAAAVAITLLTRT